jgi:hypothetical protein
MALQIMFELLLLLLMVMIGNTMTANDVEIGQLCETGIVYSNMHDCHIDCIVDDGGRFGAALLCACITHAPDQILCANRITTTDV